MIDETKFGGINAAGTSKSELGSSSIEHEDPQSFWLALLRNEEQTEAELAAEPPTGEEIEKAKELVHKYLYPDTVLRTEEETLAVLHQVYTAAHYELDKRLAKAMELINMDDLRTYGSLVTTKHRVEPASGGLSHEREYGSPLSGSFDFSKVSPHAMGWSGQPDTIAKEVNDSIDRAKNYIQRVIVQSRGKRQAA
jgi:hypothetical protein